MANLDKVLSLLRVLTVRHWDTMIRTNPPASATAASGSSGTVHAGIGRGESLPVAQLESRAEPLAA